MRTSAHYGDLVPERPRLVTTTEAARAVGISRRTLADYVRRGLVTPTITLPTGDYRWNIDELIEQFRRAREQRDRD